MVRKALHFSPFHYFTIVKKSEWWNRSFLKWGKEFKRNSKGTFKRNVKVTEKVLMHGIKYHPYLLNQHLCFTLSFTYFTHFGEVKQWLCKGDLFHRFSEKEQLILENRFSIQIPGYHNETVPGHIRNSGTRKNIIRPYPNGDKPYCRCQVFVTCHGLVYSCADGVSRS